MKSEVMALCLALSTGLFLAKIRWRTFSLGPAAILFTSLGLGALGFATSPFVQQLGMVLFILSVGLEAGPDFLTTLQGHGRSFFLIATTVYAVCTGVAWWILNQADIGVNGAMLSGIYAGALTSTPGLAMALEQHTSPLVSLGYALAYPYGVIGVILMIHLLYPWLQPVTQTCTCDEMPESSWRGGDFLTDLMVATTLILVGSWLGRWPLLGTSGGVLVAAIVGSHFWSKTNLFSALKRERYQMQAVHIRLFRELGLMLFLAGVGLAAGPQLTLLWGPHGWVPWLVGVVITTVPMVVAALLGHFVFRLERDTLLGMLAGVMTCTPGLGAISSLVQNSRPLKSYATIYPIALIYVTLMIAWIARHP